VAEGLSGCAGQILDGLIGLSPVDLLVVSIGFGVGFLQKHHPKFAVFAVAECRAVPRGTGRNVSIQLNQLPSTVDAHPNQKIAIFQIKILKQSLY
jgi:hypothetical protein